MCRFRIIFLLFLTAVLSAPSSAEIKYHLTFLPDLPGGREWSSAFDINNSGVVVGTSDSGSGAQSFRWTPSEGMTDLSSLLEPVGGDLVSNAYAINDRGEIAGSTFLDNRVRAYYLGGDNIAVLPETPYGPFHFGGHGLNNVSEIVGSFTAEGEVLPGYWSATTGFRELPLGDYTSGWAAGINDAGLIAGSVYRELGPESLMLPVAWIDGRTPAELLPADDVLSYFVRGINASGDVLIEALDLSHSQHKVIVWSQTNGVRELELIDRLGPAVNARDINASGLVVGSLQSSDQFSAILWDAEGMAWDLNELIHNPIPEFRLGIAYAINDSGQIVGAAIDSDFQFRGFVLTPIPEASSLALIATTFAIVFGRLFFRAR